MCWCWEGMCWCGMCDGVVLCVHVHWWSEVCMCVGMGDDVVGCGCI